MCMLKLMPYIVFDKKSACIADFQALFYSQTKQAVMSALFT